MKRAATITQPWVVHKHRWRPGIGMTVLVVVAGILLVGLGVWQLDRGDEKRLLVAAFYDRVGSTPVTPASDVPLPPFQPVRMTGRFDRRYFLVDNQVLDGVVGYWVVAVFATDDGRRFLVNRGFLPAGPRREQWPDVDVPEGDCTIEGVIWPDTGLVPLIGPDVWPATWPKRVQRMDPARMAAAVDGVPVAVRLERGQRGSLGQIPWTLDGAAARHDAYAVQWFAMAVALLGAYAAWGFHRGRRTPRDDGGVDG